MREIPLSASQENILAGSFTSEDPGAYLVGKRYDFAAGVSEESVREGLHRVCREHPIVLCAVRRVPGADGGTTYVLRREFEPARVVGLRCEDLLAGWESHGLTGAQAVPLVGFTVTVEKATSRVCLELHAHHVALDGGAVALVEASLGAALQERARGDHQEAASADESQDAPAALAAANQAERAASVAAGGPQALAALRTELDRLPQNFAAGATDGPGASRGRLTSEASFSGAEYVDLLGLNMGLGLDSMATAAAAAVLAARAGTSSIHVFHTVDPRFLSGDLAAATCLVNTLWFPLDFPAFVSGADLARACDRGIVRSRRRLWLREERLRRELLRHPCGHGLAVTMNVLPEPVAPELDWALEGMPEVTDIGPVEGTTVQVINNPAAQQLSIRVWEPDVSDLWPTPASPAETASSYSSTAPDPLPPLAPQIAAYLRTFAADPKSPAAQLADDWTVLPGGHAPEPAATWPNLIDLPRLLDQRPGVRAWLYAMNRAEVPPGAIVVVPSPTSEARPVDLLLATHVHGCGYTPCTGSEEVAARLEALRNAGFVGVHMNSLDPATAHVRIYHPDPPRGAPNSTEPTAYMLPTSGTTGAPKLVRVSHANLAAFLSGARARYGWQEGDVVGQCAALTSDISVEEIFLATVCGARIVPLSPGILADPWELVDATRRAGLSILDLPTSVWHAMTADPLLLEALRTSGLRQLVIGGEAVDPAALDRWEAVMQAGEGRDGDGGRAHRIELLSTYGPTEATVVATAVTLGGIGDSAASGQEAVGDAAREAGAGTTVATAVGEPLLRGGAVVAFGELLLVGAAVGPGYVGSPAPSFGELAMPEGPRVPVFATRDRVRCEKAGGQYVFAGRWDEVAKVAGQRVDLFDLRQQVGAMEGVTEVHARAQKGRLSVWFSGAANIDVDLKARVRERLAELRIPAAAVVQTAKPITRDERGRVQEESLAPLHPVNEKATESTGVGLAHQGPATEEGGVAARLATAWSRRLGWAIAPSDSLTDKAVPSLELIRLLPETRSILGWPVGVRDLLAADSAEALAGLKPASGATDRAATPRSLDQAGESSEIHLSASPTIHSSSSTISASTSTTGASVLEAGRRYDTSQTSEPGTYPDVCGTAGMAGPATLLLGATGSVGSAVLQRWLLEPYGKLIVALRGDIPRGGMWTMARQHPHVVLLPCCGTWSAGAGGVLKILADHHITTVLNCAGSVSTTAGRAELDAVNVELPRWLAECCKQTGARLVQLSSTVVAEEFWEPRVTEPGWAHFAYAESKIIGEIALNSYSSAIVVRLPRVLPSTAGAHADVLLGVLRVCSRLGCYPEVDIEEDVVTASAVAQWLWRMVRQLHDEGGEDDLPAGVRGPELAGGALKSAAGAGLGSAPGGGATLVVHRGLRVSYRDILPSAIHPALLPDASPRAPMLPSHSALHGQGANDVREFADPDVACVELREWKSRLDRSGLAQEEPELWGLLDEWVALVEVFQRRPWAGIPARRLGYAGWRSLPVGADLRVPDILRLAGVGS
ncbi:AMP-binding protein [Corynebacterium heidelbergense]|uniref:Uncharacterized protein n=1 Tax=Corynebacterium heidelbergense TaxID=2055947 RepID=A0A364VA92_9CORY|nr:AMP-binding protein [Corynebacterium heidelbergense]RAV33486.1 hypothetical protein CWC39_08235 [Corynebacterium heidelbergense]WCZ35653.1 Surfactin synthase subunit 2 [Corynebacterium heidelbergense]